MKKKRPNKKKEKEKKKKNGMKQDKLPSNHPSANQIRLNVSSPIGQIISHKMKRVG
jgi:hypothetical protein